MGKDAKLNININKDDSELNNFLYCWDKFQSRPNKLIIYNSFAKNTFTDIISGYTKSKTVFTEVIPDKDPIINDQMLIMVNENLYLSYLVIDRNNENSIIHDIIFFFKDYDNDLPNINKIIGDLDDCIVNFGDDEEHSRLNTATISQSVLDIEPIEMNGLDTENIDMYYDKDTFKSIEKLCRLIKKSKKGLSIFYGLRGTGKTSIIDYIGDKVGKIVIFIPNNLVESTINSPEFKKFLTIHSNSIIVMDDCEVLFNDMFFKSNITATNLLQMVDGFSSDIIDVNIITIFNTDDEEDIDRSLLECNNLLDIIEFDLLDIESSNELSTHIGSKKKYKNKTRVIDIIKKRSINENKKVGF